MKRFDLMALYHQQACIKSDQGNYVTIRLVKNYDNYRLCRTKGNVNLTDYWFAMVDANKEQPIGYNCQFISIISDEMNTVNWWEGCDEKQICLGFFKFRLEELNASMWKIQEMIIKCADGVKSRMFRTLDNADCIFVFFADSDEKLQEIIDKIKKVEWMCEDNGKRESVFFTDYYLTGKCNEFTIKDKDLGGEINELRISNCTFKKGGATPQRKIYKGGWCVRTIEILRKEIAEYENAKNKKMIAYYQGLLQIVNVISQYEQDVLLKDMFYIFYPPIRLFRKQLKAGNDLIQELYMQEKEAKEDTIKNDLISRKYIQMQKLESGISEFLDTVEMLMRHMGQSCPDMINDTGRQGMPYDIPMRLCLMYISYLNVITSLLNDTENEYQYCLAPLVYSRPTTNFIDFGLPPESRLIRVRISRHCMFMPRSSMIILAHEVSHYIGDKTRERKERAQRYTNAVSILLTCMIIPYSIMSDCGLRVEKGRKENLEIYLQSVRANVNCYIRKCINDKIEEEADKGKEYIYHLSELYEIIISICYDILYDDRGELKKRLTRLDEKLLSRMKLLEQEEGLIRDIYELQKAMSDRSTRIWAEKEIHRYMANLKTVFKETYTDLSSILLLDLSPVDYLEALLISESYDPDPDIIQTVLINRVGMVKIVMENDPESDKWSKRWDSIDSESLKHNKFLLELKKRVDSFCAQYNNENIQETQENAKIGDKLDIMYCKEILDEERSYFEKCKTSLCDHIKEKNRVNGCFDRKKILQELYKQFAVYEKNEDLPVDDFFKAYGNLVECYKADVKKSWKSDVEQIDFQKKV